MHENQTILDRFAAVRAALRRRRALLALVQALGVLAVLLLAAEITELTLGLRESTSIFLSAGLLLVALLAFAWTLARAVFFQPSNRQLADRIETAHPELMDSLHAAVEKEPLPESSRRVLEDALVKDVQQSTSALSFESVVIPRWMTWRRLALSGAIFALFLVAVSQGRFLVKSSHGLAAALGHGNPGLRVEPGDAELPRHSDLQVTAFIDRWEPTATVQYSDGIGAHEFPMSSGSGDGEAAHFTFYGISGPMQYRIVTPSLTSAWYTVRPYDPPEIHELEVEVASPAYTGLEPQRLNELADLAVIEGSTVRITAKVDPGIQLEFMLDDQHFKAETIDAATRVVTIRPEVVGSYALHLTDGSGHDMMTDRFRLDLVRDLPPVIDVAKPGRDTSAKLDAIIELAADAADDFGVDTVTFHYSVSGGARQQLSLFNAGKGGGATGAPERKPERDVRIATTLDVATFNAEYGDMVSYFLTVTDNRVPAPQTTRSEIFFLELRPELDPQEMPGGMEPEKLPVHKLIAELKRLIRLTYDWMAAEEDERNALQQSLATGLADTKTEAYRQLELLQKQVPPNLTPEQVPLIRTFKDGVAAVERAENLVRRELPEESVPEQERALSRFVAVAQELANNMQGSGEGQGDSESTEQQQQQEQAQSESKEAQPTLEQQRRVLEELLKDVNRLADRQGAANAQVQRAQDHDLSAAERAEMVKTQDGVAKDTNRLSAPLPGEAPLGQVKASLEDAADEMSGAERALTQSDNNGARSHGRRAHKQLLAAAGQVRQLLDGLAAAQIQQLAQQASRLQESQSSAASASQARSEGQSEGQPSPGQMREGQAEIKEGTESLLNQVAGTAGTMRGAYPDVSEALAEAIRQAQKSNLTGEMTRAENALLYEAFERASQFQEGAAGKLAELAAGLNQAADAMPRISQEQLMAALQELRTAQMQLQAAQNGTESGAQSTLQSTTGNTASMLGQIGDALKDGRFREVSGQLRATGDAGDPKAGISQAQQLLEVAARMIQSHLYSAELERRIGLTRKLADPPEKYRSLVEEYFRELSESE